MERRFEVFSLRFSHICRRSSWSLGVTILNMADFPKLPNTALTRDDIICYLSEQRQRGYDVFQGPQGDHFFVLMLTDVYRINFVIGNNGCQLQGEQYGQPFAIADVTSLIELRRAADGIAQKVLGGAWARAPMSGRVAQHTPASNLATISNLVGTSAVEAIFDPYLENRSLVILIDVLSFGKGTVANGVRMLSTSKTAGGQIPRLTKTAFDAWLAQLKIKGEIRLMAPSEHRRFMLLSGGQSLLLGQSLNSLHKNEAVRVEPDNADRAFFDQIWANAKPLT